MWPHDASSWSPDVHGALVVPSRCLQWAARRRASGTALSHFCQFCLPVGHDTQDGPMTLKMPPTGESDGPGQAPQATRRHRRLQFGTNPRSLLATLLQIRLNMTQNEVLMATMPSILGRCLQLAPEVAWRLPEKVSRRLKTPRRYFQDAQDGPNMIHNSQDILTMDPRCCQMPDAAEMRRAIFL